MKKVAVKKPTNETKTVSVQHPAVDYSKRFNELSEAFKADRQKLAEAGQPIDARVDQFVTDTQGLFNPAEPNE